MQQNLTAATLKLTIRQEQLISAKNDTGCAIEPLVFISPGETSGNVAFAVRRSRRFGYHALSTHTRYWMR
jgi:hypothetical protein